VLLDGGADIAVVDQMKRTSLHWAALAPQSGEALACMSLLFERSAEVCTKQINMQTKSGATPLHCACSSGRADMARFLLDRGADPSLEDDDGKNCPALAKENGMPKDLFKSDKEKGRRESTSGKKSGGFFSKLRRMSSAKPQEVPL
jgi:ankyrin repeat protein